MDFRWWPYNLSNTVTYSVTCGFKWRKYCAYKIVISTIQCKLFHHNLKEWKAGREWRRWVRVSKLDMWCFLFEYLTPIAERELSTCQFSEEYKCFTILLHWCCPWISLTYHVIRLTIKSQKRCYRNKPLWNANFFCIYIYKNFFCCCHCKNYSHRNWFCIS